MTGPFGGDQLVRLNIHHASGTPRQAFVKPTARKDGNLAVSVNGDTWVLKPEDRYPTKHWLLWWKVWATWEVHSGNPMSIPYMLKPKQELQVDEPYLYSFIESKVLQDYFKFQAFTGAMQKMELLLMIAAGAAVVAIIASYFLYQELQQTQASIQHMQSTVDAMKTQVQMLQSLLPEPPLNRLNPVP